MAAIVLATFVGDSVVVPLKLKTKQMCDGGVPKSVLQQQHQHCTSGHHRNGGKISLEISSAMLHLKETPTLIDAYHERWCALWKGDLCTADWDAVEAIINSLFSDAPIPKTPKHCRHKMEKQYEDYRSEKQQYLSYLYPIMDNGTLPFLS
ncbi:Hypothetical predicted protein [Olea europaea subsp. europaea]|uniref:Uncharacterized protein n=1 Tax=Olea europaea subsp. europaea TaxID=158383 RepID=A0A8S0S4W8_OLEEU|nr:Hypothetical predicted protein [Olea europaea subsp. europaea]